MSSKREKGNGKLVPPVDAEANNQTKALLSPFLASIFCIASKVTPRHLYFFGELVLELMLNHLTEVRAANLDRSFQVSSVFDVSNTSAARARLR